MKKIKPDSTLSPRTGIRMKDWTGELQERFRTMYDKKKQIDPVFTKADIASVRKYWKVKRFFKKELSRP